MDAAATRTRHSTSRHASLSDAVLDPATMTICALSALPWPISISLSLVLLPLSHSLCVVPLSMCLTLMEVPCNHAHEFPCLGCRSRTGRRWTTLRRLQLLQMPSSCHGATWASGTWLLRKWRQCRRWLSRSATSLASPSSSLAWSTPWSPPRAVHGNLFRLENVWEYPLLVPTCSRESESALCWEGIPTLLLVLHWRGHSTSQGS
jgi:hypothetical protein